MKLLHLISATCVLILGLAGSAEARVGPNETPVREWRDSASGARVAVFKASPAETDFEISDGFVSLRKHVSSGRSEMTIRTAGDEVVVTLMAGRLEVKGRGQRLELSAEARQGTDALRAWMNESAAVQRALLLLARIQAGDDSPVKLALAGARLQLLALSGRPAAGQDLQEWTRRVARQLATVRTEAAGPTECWVMYAKEAITAWIEYDQCVDDEQWWDVVGIAACVFVYEIRAVGAFSWWMTCVGFHIT